MEKGKVKPKDILKIELHNKWVFKLHMYLYLQVRDRNRTLEIPQGLIAYM